MKRIFAIPSLLAAGLFPAQAVALAVARLDDQPDRFSLFDLFNQSRAQILSAHRSHSSHASHGSHRSSSGGGYAVPRTYPPVTITPAPAPPSRNYGSTPPSSVLPSPPAAAPKGGAPNAGLAQPGDRFRDTVMLLQLALRAYGYYTGSVDGVVGPETSASISRMQADYRLNVTGTVTPELLNALKIPAQ